MNDLLKTAVVRKCPTADAREFLCYWHYSRRMPSGKNILYGWYVTGQTWGDLLGEGIYAVACYGIGVNSFQASFLAKLTGKGVTNENLLELKRLARVEPKIEALPLTAFLARCHKRLKKEGYKFIISFSDPAHGHNGGIYRAANFMALGKSKPETHYLDQLGNLRHRRYPGRWAERAGCSVAQAVERLKLTSVKTVAKDRWLLEL